MEVLDVVNRGVTFPRPASHLGKPLMTTTPVGIGDLALAYLDKMIGEVEVIWLTPLVFWHAPIGRLHLRIQRT